jgi:adenine/guanine phosphoribosyltransferase-like PRPP-binding protein
LIVSGTSGVWLGAVLTLRQDLPVVIVRKPGEDSHGGVVEGDCYASNGVIVDDFVSSGATVDRIADALDRHGRISVAGVIEHNRKQRSGRARYYRIRTDIDEPEMPGINRIRVVPCDYANKGGY